ncbi:MAG: right-handed parallel beta-helix repeat-containing protein [Thermoplasmata archaeon]|nr:right-handed parallel beta-helix repeat-containing protein [Thermoplasmata archaeon]
MSNQIIMTQDLRGDSECDYSHQSLKGKTRAGMLLIFVSFFLMVITIQSPCADAGGPTYVGGSMLSDTTWNISESPYVAVANVTIEDGVALVIEAGTVIKLNPFTRLMVNGTLLAIGSDVNRIIFTSNRSLPAPGDWSSIRFNENSSNSSVIRYARIEYAIYGVWCIRSSPTIENSIIDNAKTKGIYLQESNATIVNNRIVNVSNKGIDILHSSPSVVGNTIGNTTYYGIKCYGSSAIITNNTISDAVNGLYLKESTATILGNRVLSTGYGIYLEHAPGTVILDNRVEESGYGIYLAFSNSTVVSNTTMVEIDFGLYIMSSSLFIENSTILISQHKDFHIAGESHLVTLNTSFDGSKVLMSSGSTLTVKNFLAVKVENKNGFALPNASVGVEDNFTTLHELSTDVHGLSEWIIVTDRIYEGVDIAAENVTTVGVSYDTLPFPDNPRDVDMSTSHTEVFKVNTKPTVNITSPSDGEMVDGAITVSGTSFDENGVVTGVEIRIDNSSWQTVTMLASNWSVWSYQWDTTQHPNGEHNLTARAVDDCLENFTHSITVNVENEDTVIAEDSDIGLPYLWILLTVPFLVLILSIAYWRKRKKKRDDEMAVERPEEAKPEIASDARIERIERAFEDGFISEKVYESNLERLREEETESSKEPETEETFSYVCPICSNEVDADATECPSCGAAFED